MRGRRAFTSTSQRPRRPTSRREWPFRFFIRGATRRRAFADRRHLPLPSRPLRRGHDEAEVSGARNAFEAKVPVFVVAPGPSGKTRTLHRGFIEDVSDKQQALLITFSDGRDFGAAVVPPSVPFELTSSGTHKLALVKVRPNQARFAFEVFERYGRICAVCGLSESSLIQAAHLRSKKTQGSDDPRNGIPLCANHHLALDRHLFGIEPESMEIRVRRSGPSLDELRATLHNLKHMPNLPHSEAIEHAWLEWLRAN